jgi:hypothetical protein
MRRAVLNSLEAFVLALVCLAPATLSRATSAIALRSRYRVVLAADSLARYGVNTRATECKLFQIGDVYATVSGLAHYGRSYRATDAIRDGFGSLGTFEDHVAATAYSLQRRTEQLLAHVEESNPAEYRALMLKASRPADFVQLALAQSVNGKPMLGIVQLQWDTRQNRFRTVTSTCPGRCGRDAGIFYLGYWERIKPYVADAGQPRSIGSAASIDRLIRMEMNAHPGDVGAPINILEVNSSGARWLQNGGNCSLPGVGW